MLWKCFTISALHFELEQDRVPNLWTSTSINDNNNDDDDNDYNNNNSQ